MRDATAITNLLYRYAELMDAGDFAAVADLFTHARIKVGLDQAELPRLRGGARDVGRDGHSLRRRHPADEARHDQRDRRVPERRRRRPARSYYTVLQQVGDAPLQVIIAGRYHDKFERVDGTWRFCERDYTLVDLVGDLSRHLRMEVPQR